MNRALIVQSFFPSFEIQGESQSEDVLHLKKSLSDLRSGQRHFYCGDGGTTLRFLLARLSREKGRFVVSGTKRLMGRPHSELFEILQNLGCEVDQQSDGLHLKSDGWKVDQPIKVDTQTSSQFLSALLLSSWDFSQSLRFEFEEGRGSFSYYEMTFDFLKSMGMQIEKNSNGVVIPAAQIVKATSYEVEPDMSSAFVVAALAVVSGQAEIAGFPKKSLQPDYRFIEILKHCGAKIDLSENTLIVERGDLQSVRLNLQSTPDLFPVLSTLLAGAGGTSFLQGLETLPNKESNRIQKTLELIEKMGGSVSWDGQTFKIEGCKSWSKDEIVFDPDQDHRMAMAAAVAQKMGLQISILHPEVVNKSFPSFWKVVNQ